MGATAAGRLVGFVRPLLAVLVCAAAVALPAHAASAAPKPTPGAAPASGIGLRLIEAPAATANDPRARMYIVDHLNPDTVIRRQIEVTNGSPSTAHVVLYAAAAAVTDGTFLGAIGVTPNDLSSWTSVSPSSVNVPARGRVRMTVTIDVPRDAAPGEQYGVVWAEARSTPPAGGGVTQVSRVGIRLYLSVGPGGAPAANFVVESLTAARSAAGQPMIRAQVRNTGGRALDMNGTLNLLGGPGGLSAGPFDANLGVTLAIGAVEPVTIMLDKQVPAGPWKARITLRSGLVERSAEATISFPAAGAAPPVSTRAAAVPVWRYLAVGGLVVVLLLAGAVVFALRRRRNRSESQYLSRSSAGADSVRVPVAAVKPPIPALLIAAVEPETVEPETVEPETVEPLTVAEPVVEVQPVTVVEPVILAVPAAPPLERRRPVTDRASRLAEQPVTVDAIADAQLHWQLALPNSQDALTSLANRSLFEDETQYAMDAGAERLCLLRIGLEQFDEINRVHGREMGDEILVALVERLRISVRPKDLTGRLGGVDFAVLFEDVQEPDMNTIAQRILQAVREPFTVAGELVSVQASVGIAAAGPTDDATRLLRHATDALAFVRITAGAEHQWYVEGMASTGS